MSGACIYSKASESFSIVPLLLREVPKDALPIHNSKPACQAKRAIASLKGTSGVLHFPRMVQFSSVYATALCTIGFASIMRNPDSRGRPSHGRHACPHGVLGSALTHKSLPLLRRKAQPPSCDGRDFRSPTPYKPPKCTNDLLKLTTPSKDQSHREAACQNASMAKVRKSQRGLLIAA